MPKSPKAQKVCGNCGYLTKIKNEDGSTEYRCCKHGKHGKIVGYWEYREGWCPNYAREDNWNEPNR